VPTATEICICNYRYGDINEIPGLTATDRSRCSADGQFEMMIFAAE